jgi:hypothetical protein
MRTKSIGNRLAQLKAEIANTVEQEGTDIYNEWKNLFDRAVDLKELDPTYVTPWEELFPPADDQRLLQIPNCKAAVLKVLPTKESQAIRPNQIVEAIQRLKLSYSPTTVLQTISNLKREAIAAQDLMSDIFSDTDGYVITWTDGNRPSFYKFKA